MHTREMRDHFKRIYPQCSTTEIENLVSAIKSKKYWKVHSERKDALYAVALTRAQIQFKDGYKAKSTAPSQVVVVPKAVRFCRRGRILLVKKRGESFLSETVIEWPAFLQLLRQDQNIIYQFFVENPDPPVFVNRRILKFSNLNCVLKDKGCTHKVE